MEMYKHSEKTTTRKDKVCYLGTWRESGHNFMLPKETSTRFFKHPLCVNKDAFLTLVFDIVII